MGEVAVAAAQRIEQQQSYRKGQILHYLRLYGSRADKVGSRWTQGKGTESFREDVRRRLSLNVVRNMVDAATSRLSKGRPSPQSLTSAGDYSLQRQARMRDKFIQGHFYQGEFWALRDRVIKSQALLGTGVVQTFERYGKVCYEYVFPGELFVDDAEAMLAYPRNIYRIAPFDKQVLKALFPAQAAEIESAQTSSGLGKDSGEQVTVYRAWHLPSSPDAKDGRYCAAIEGATLGKPQKWTRDKFPFSFWRWSEEPVGFWGSGLGEQLSGIQLEINQLLRMVQENCYRGGNLKVLLEHGANILESEINNSLRGTVIRYNGTKPDFHVHDVISNQILSHLQYLVQSAYEITGISQLSASGQIPGGLAGSGRAQLVYKNIESERFVTVQRSDEAAVLDVANQTINTGRDILERDGSYKIQYRAENWIEDLDAKEALEDLGPFEMQVLPASQLPHDYAGRVAFAGELEAKGWVDRDTAMDLADVPDVNAAMELELAPKRLIDSEIEKILEDGQNFVPTPRMNLQLAYERGSRAWQHARLKNYPPERLDLLNTWLEQIQDLMNAANPPAPPLPETAGVGLPGQAAPAEASQLEPVPAPARGPGMPQAIH